MDDKAFGKRIHAYRKQHGWKQNELVERWGVTQEHVSQIERGRYKPDRAG